MITESAATSALMVSRPSVGGQSMMMKSYWSSAHIGERLAQDVLAADGAEQLVLGRRQVDVRRRDVDARGLGRHDDVLDGDVGIDERVRHRSLDGPRIEAQADGQVGLRIHVHAQDAVALLGQRAGEVDGGGRLADAALLVRDGDDAGHAASFAGWMGPIGRGDSIARDHGAAAREFSTLLAVHPPFLWIDAAATMADAGR